MRFSKIIWKLWSAIVFWILILEQNVFGLICRTIWVESRTLNRTLGTVENEILERIMEILCNHIFRNPLELHYHAGQNCGTNCFLIIAKIILISILWVMKFVLLIMWKLSKLSSKLVWNKVVSLNFEEVIAKKVQISMFS